jgi:hypothetical protein
MTIAIEFEHPAFGKIEITEETFLIWHHDAAERGQTLEEYFAAHLPADQAAAFARITEAIAQHRGGRSDEEEHR